MSCAFALSILMLFGSGCAAQPHEPPPVPQSRQPNSSDTLSPAPQPQSPSTDNLSADSSLDQILDALDERGQNLQSLATDVTLTESDATTGDDVSRTGRFVLQIKADGSARSRVNFDTRIANNRKTEEKIEYLLDGPNLIDRTYRTKTQVTRQVLKPGEKINLLKLGEGPFPLPIGQDKAEVHRMFEAKKIEPAEEDPPNTVHLQLIPRAGSQFANRFHSIDAWVDLNDHMPKRIETVDPNGVTIRTTDLTNVQINPRLSDADFALARITEAGWNLYNEAYQE